MHIPDHITEDFITHYASVTHRRKKQAALLTSAELEKKGKNKPQYLPNNRVHAEK